MKIEKKDLEYIDFLIKEERYQDALDIFSKIKTLNSYKAKYLKALALEGSEKFDEAITILEDLYKKNPENLNVIIKMANISEELELYEQSMEYYERILFLDPFNKKAKEKIEELKNPKSKDKKDVPDEKNNIEPEIKGELPDLNEMEEVVTKESEEEQPAEAKDDDQGPVVDEKQEIEFEKIDIGDEFDKRIEIDKNGFKDNEPKKIDESNDEEIIIDKSDNKQSLKSEEAPEDKPEAELNIKAADEKTEEKEINDIIPDNVHEQKNVPEKESSPKKDNFKNFIDEDINNYFKIDQKKEVKVSETEVKEEKKIQNQADEYGFITESAAKLYEKQKLYDEAISVYEKLEKMNEIPDLYTKEISKIKKIRKYNKTIDHLNNLKNELIKGA